ncbi:MAG: beta-phosphoglucomutase family hydrolase [Deltaproteobacteria bacterium]|nr:beta-phosphoglucomutase family hydrolase [Deltaproteobacteria bacterium]
MTSRKFKGAIFDLDGVVTNTAHMHTLAWEDMFNEFLKRLAEKESRPFVPFDRAKDYIQYVDGKPRMEGIISFLKSRDIELSYGDINDPPEKETICGLGSRKNLKFQEMLRKEKPRIYKTSVRFIKNLRKKGIKVGVASSSCNCRRILQVTGIEDLFETRVDGQVSQELNLKGKPNPDIFITSARRMGLMPSDCMVVEDAVSGVQAGKSGNFGLTLGIARKQNGEILKQNGADVVLYDLAEISDREIEDWFKKSIKRNGWHLEYDGFDLQEENLRESLCTVGNGYLGTRGCFEGEHASDVHYPGTYIAGMYNKLGTKIQNKIIYNNDFVNCPNWLLIEFKIGYGNYISPLKMELLSYRQTLDMKRGALERFIVCKDALGRITRIHSERIASMANPHLLAIRYNITPVNYSERITVRSTLDGTVINDGVPRYRQLNSKHLCEIAQGKTEDGIFLHVQTSHSKRQIIMNARVTVSENGELLSVKKKTLQRKAKISEEMGFPARENFTYTVEKLVTVYTSLDRNITDIKKTAFDTLFQYKDFDSIYRPHIKAWESLWDKFDIRIEGDSFSQKAIRLHIYHLLVTASPHNTQIDAGMPARGLHGEAYRGHIFWDELYILPFFNLHAPEITRALLMYRYKRLDGAMYPWQTADDGSEETQIIHYNPQDGTWGPDLSRLQRHVSIAIFYNIWRYFSDTEDKEFLENYGAEIMLEIARFWASIARYDENTKRYHIKGVMGPDEYHEKRPGSEVDGLKDNAYTNIMTVWLLEKAIDLIDGLPEKVLRTLREKLAFKISETEKWKRITEKMNVILSKGNIISQFDGYMDLKEFNWDDYRTKYGNIQRMDRILKAEGDSPNAYKVAKQADTLMLFYLIGVEEVCRIIEKLGFDAGNYNELLMHNYKYYEKRTSHGSTLSNPIHGIISSNIKDAGNKMVWDRFIEAIKADIFDTQEGSTGQGIHCGMMAGTIGMISRCFAGIEVSGEALELNPHMPEHWNKLSFKIFFRDIWYHLEFTKKDVSIKIEGKVENQIPIKIVGKNKLHYRK